MSTDLINMLLSVVAAVVSGVIVFFIGELWKERWLDPLHEFRVLRRKIETALSFYKNKYTVLVDARFHDEASAELYAGISKNLRSLASELSSSISELPNFRVNLPSNKDILEAAKELIGLSNNIPCISNSDANMSKENREYEKDILRLLGLPYSE